MSDAQTSWLAKTLSLDVPRLRDTLEAIHREVARPVRVSLVSVNAALLSDRDRIAASIRSLCEVLGTADLNARSALAGHMPRLHNAPVERLAGVLDTLHRLWADRLHRTLGPGKTEVVRAYLSRRLPDLLSVLGRLDDENTHSDVLRWLLDPRQAPGVACPALAALAGCLDDPASWRDLLKTAIDHDLLSVRREFVIGRDGSPGEGLDRIDLVLSGPSFVLALENKVWSSEHANQTETYWHWLSRLPARTGGLFLTPAGRTAACPHFKPVSYLQLLSCLLEGPAHGTISVDEEFVLASYVRSLAVGILRTELRTIQEEVSREWTE